MYRRRGMGMRRTCGGFGISVRPLLFLLTLALLWTSSINVAISHSAEYFPPGHDLGEWFGWEKSDAMAVLKILKDYDLLKEENEKLQKDLRASEKQTDLEKRENELNKKINDIQQREIEMHKRSFEQMTILVDKSLKLAEISKPQSNWQTYGLAALAVFMAGFLLGR